MQAYSCIPVCAQVHLAHYQPCQSRLTHNLHRYSGSIISGYMQSMTVDSACWGEMVHSILPSYAHCALPPQDGNNYNARLRRLAMAQRQREGSDAEGSSEQSGSSNGSDEDDSQPMDMDAIEQMSDDEAKAELKAYHQQQLREAAHVSCCQTDGFVHLPLCCIAARLRQ